MTNYNRQRRNGSEPGKDAATLPVMSAKQMRERRRHGEKWVLPGTGDVVLLRRPGLRAQAAGVGVIKNGLSDRTIKFVARLSASSLLDQENKTEAEQMQAFQEETEVFYEILEQAFVSPKFVYRREPNEEANEIGPEDVGDYNVTWIVYRYCMGAVEEIERFRVDTSDGEPGRNGETVRLPTIANTEG
jgi:hypothetical protein